VDVVVGVFGAEVAAELLAVTTLQQQHRAGRGRGKDFTKTQSNKDVQNFSPNSTRRSDRISNK